MKKPSKTNLKKKLDDECRRITRSKGYCEWNITKKCNSLYENLQWHHVFPRDYMATRWDLDNSICLCKGCHLYWHLNPLEAEDWIKSYIGEVKYLSLRAKANSIKQWKIYEMEDLLATLKQT